MGFHGLGKVLILAAALLLLGAALLFVDRIPFIGKLPGDIGIERENFRIYFPLTSSISISVIVALGLRLFSYLKGNQVNTILIFGVGMTLVASAMAQQSDIKEKSRTISVRGEGTSTATPDQVRLTVNVNTRGQSASAAMRSASSKTAELLSLLKGMGVEEKNIQTSRVNVSPTYDYSKQIQPPPIVGYHSSNDFSVLFKGTLMDKVGEFLDKAVSAGATNFGGLQYEASTQRQLEREALKNAADDARARADILAKQLGASLGQVLTISESVSGGVPVPVTMRAAAMMDAASPAPVMSGELSLRAEVHVVFELK